MNKNLLWKLAIVVGSCLSSCSAYFGIPQTFSGQGLLSAMTNRIHLGLDLRGGTHLILQVQVNDAVNIDSTMRSKSSKSSSISARLPSLIFPTRSG